MRMLFGKYAGCPIENLPDFYLAWLGGLNLVNVGLRKAVHEELRRRECNELNLQLAVADAALLLQLIEAGSRVLGLDTDKRQRLEPVVESLEQALQEVQTEV